MFKSRISVLIAVFFVFGFIFAAMAQDARAQCEFTISKVEIPDRGEIFDFQFTGDLIDSFSLANGDSAPFMIPVDAEAQLVEDIPNGYDLSIECVNGVTNCGVEEFVPCLNFEVLEDGSGVIVECLDDDTGSCTFTNRSAIRSSVPTLSEWGLIAMAAVLGIIAVMVIRRKAAA